MEKRPTYNGAYSLLFAAVTVMVGVAALVRRDGTVTMAVAILGLYILHLLSLRAVTRDQAARPVSSQGARSGNRKPISVPDRASVLRPRDEPGASASENISERPVFLSPQSGFVSEVGQATIPERARPTTEDSAWMVQLSESDEEPEFLPADSDSPPPAYASRSEEGINVPIPRKFALGTVAIIRRVLDPAEVARVLEEQRVFPKKRFGEIAVDLGLMSDQQLDELLDAQRDGLFTEEEIQSARARLEAFRRDTSSAPIQ
jgi:hypothetical protein